MAKKYQGNLPGNVSKDAKYSVIGTHRDEKIRLIYRLSSHEEALLTTRTHPTLVKMVNDVKEEHADKPGGAFYINEHGHVIVPVGKPVHYYYAGQYPRHLEFEFESSKLSPRAPTGMRPGQVWRGPHVGIPYVLTANGTDFYFKRESRPGVIRQYNLSDEVGEAPARQLAERLRLHKRSGRIYINEAHEFFTRLEATSGWSYIYLGNLGGDAWFPAPTV